MRTRWSGLATVFTLLLLLASGCRRVGRLGGGGCKPAPNDEVSFVVRGATGRNASLDSAEMGTLVVHVRGGSPDRPVLENVYVRLDLDPVPKTVAQPLYVQLADSTGVAIFPAIRPRKYGFEARDLFFHERLRRAVVVRKGYVDTVDVTLARKPECWLGVRPGSASTRAQP